VVLDKALRRELGAEEAGQEEELWVQPAQQMEGREEMGGEQPVQERAQMQQIILPLLREQMVVEEGEELLLQR